MIIMRFSFLLEWNDTLYVDEGEAFGLLSAINWVYDLQLDEMNLRLTLNEWYMKDVLEFGAIICKCRYLFSLYFNKVKLHI
jgi:hypothetical protein